MHVTIIDSIYLSRIRNYIVGYQNVACGGCAEGLDRVAWGFAGYRGRYSGVGWMFGVFGVWIGRDCAARV